MRKRQVITGTLALVFAALFAWWYLATDELPAQATFVTPYVTTLVVLSLATQRLRPPAADGIPYREGED